MLRTDELGGILELGELDVLDLHPSGGVANLIFGAFFLLAGNATESTAGLPEVQDLWWLRKVGNVGFVSLHEVLG